MVANISFIEHIVSLQSLFMTPDALLLQHLSLSFFFSIELFQNLHLFLLPVGLLSRILFHNFSSFLVDIFKHLRQRLIPFLLLFEIELISLVLLKSHHLLGSFAIVLGLEFALRLFNLFDVCFVASLRLISSIFEVS